MWSTLGGTYGVEAILKLLHSFYQAETPMQVADFTKREYLDREALDALVALCDREARLTSEHTGATEGILDRADPYFILNAITESLYTELLELAIHQGTMNKSQPPYIITPKHVTHLLNTYGVNGARFLVEE